MAKEITIECIKAEKTTDIPNIFHKIYSNEENRKILIHAIKSVFGGPKFTTYVREQVFYG